MIAQASYPWTMSESPNLPGARRATAADVASRAGVSGSTVGYVLNNTPGQTISKATAARVRAAARELNYQPHRAAQALARGTSDIVFVILPGWPAAHTFNDIVEASSERLAEHGFALLTQVRQSQRARPVWRSIEPVLVAAFTPFDKDEIQLMRSAGIRHILEISVTTPATVGGTLLQFEHLYSLGHRRLGFAASADSRFADISNARAMAFEETAEASGVTCLTRAVSIDLNSADQAITLFLKAGVTAVAAFNDEIAVALLSAMYERGLSAPDDLAVIGQDDSPIAKLLIPHLSSVAADAPAYGRHLAELVLATMLEGEYHDIDADMHTLVARQSTTGVK
jgi:DNA-binding LacI/PurR family transcriptional regulator